jgi:alkylated DNA repair dioxygenase AlkB
MNPIYKENFMSGELVEKIFKEVLDLPWITERTARREYFMSFIPRVYSYGNKHLGETEYTSNDFSPSVAVLCRMLNFANSNNYNVCFLNRYEDDKQHLGWHSDNFPGMDETQPIGVVSLGAEREIYWRLKGDSPVINKQRLAHGSLWVMPAGFQDLYLHKIPKGDRPCGVRISLTFRSFK